jgi:uncharacterized protein (DUF1501 family)
MRRRTFIKSLGLASLSLDGVIATASNQFSKTIQNLPLDSDAFKNRKLVIVQLHGGNDGLNTVIPISEYDNYALLRPTIKLEQNELITVDSTLDANKQIGFHPTLTKFKTLYDEGKLNVIQSVGYPSPNYSHFRSTDIILRGLDGVANQNIEDKSGWMAKYLSAVHPNYSGLPAPNLPHPLGIHIGTSSTNTGFEHQTNFNMGINIDSKARESFYGQLSMAPPQQNNSEYRDLLDYVKSVDQGAQQYNSAIENAFYAGSNSYSSYPNSSLAKQFKVISKLIAGGLESKVYTTYKGGFDTHVNQVLSTDSAAGTHTSRLNDVAESIYAFQKDLEQNGKADEVVIVVISEFGRKIKENGNRGTDHGDLAPWFVIGNHIKAGVTGRNINLDPSLVSGAGRTLDNRQYDYRQIVSTICQDWFGGNDQVLDDMTLDSFKGEIDTPNGKIDIIDDDQKVGNNNQIKVLTPAYIAVDDLDVLKEENGWTYYGKSNQPNNYLFAIEKKPITGNTQDFTPSIQIKNLYEDGQGKNYFVKANNDTKHLILGLYWTIADAPNLDGFINIRLFIHSDRIHSLENKGNSFQTDVDVHHNSGLIWLKTKQVMTDINQNSRVNGFNQGVYPLKNQSSGIYEGQSFIQFNQIEDINDTSGVASQIVFEKNTPSTRNRKTGEIYFDKRTKTFRGWNGNKWVDLNF